MLAFKVVSEEEYNSTHSEKMREEERKRNMLILLKLRPGFFTSEEQARFEETSFEIKKTGLLVAAGFISTSASRVWMIKNENKSILLGIFSIAFSYIPAFAWYKYYQQ